MGISIAIPVDLYSNQKAACINQQVSVSAELKSVVHDHINTHSKHLRRSIPREFNVNLDKGFGDGVENVYYHGNTL